MNKPRQYQDIARAIRDLIAEARLKPGDRLTPERGLSERLGVSRSLVREALILLEIEGAVEVRKGSGIYISSNPHATSVPARDDIGPFELLQARQLIEADIAGFAARMVTKNDILRLREALELERADLERGASEYSGDRAFHRLIAEATQNSVLVDVVEELWRKREQSPMWARLHNRIFETTYRRAWLDDHQAIMTALQARNPEQAQTAMWQHLGNVRDTLMALSDVDDPAFDGYLFEPVSRTG
ncbi:MULTISPECIES: FCD domain-containing protein [unclassified Roseivivax]|uniref:FCD domain-containing protein n=1 Tax=Roseivivax sp. GX 12232 TaxID=2900547 RepID=UPI001E5D4563|nr:FCD domain-containing protein [Roseivivax sp. GX 12232]MCE0506307.1 FCD domain-containing protein [Roseivivax sp. GX 12232]